MGLMTVVASWSKSDRHRENARGLRRQYSWDQREAQFSAKYLIGLDPAALAVTFSRDLKAPTRKPIRHFCKRPRSFRFSYAWLYITSRYYARPAWSAHILFVISQEIFSLSSSWTTWFTAHWKHTRHAYRKGMVDLFSMGRKIW